MTIFDFPGEIKRRNALLYWTGLGHAILFLVLLLLYFIDDRQVMNINTWIKPMKFALSITIYVLTFGWLLYYLPNPRHARWISIIIVISMLAEMSTITLQAARGIPSHYNIASALNAIIFSIMGLFIALNTLANLTTLLLFFNPKIQLPRSEQIAWQFGLALLCMGSISGGIMVVLLSHTVGAPDGGPGLPFVNWSTVAGDIRVAHFFTLHGLQFVPLLWWLISCKLKWTKRTWAVTTLSIGYLLICIGLHATALLGQPLPLIH